MQSSIYQKKFSLIPKLEKYSTWIALGLFVLLILGAFTQLFEDWIPTSKNTEYWWSVDYSEGRNIYPYEEDGFIEGHSCAYMPVYFIVTGNAMKVFGTSPIVGKLISTFAALGAAMLIYLIGSKLSGQKLFSIVLGALFLMYPVLIDYSSSEVKIDILGLFLSTLGLYLVVTKHYIWAVFPAVLAFFTKQFYIAVPLAVGLYLLWTNRKELVKYAGLYLLLIGVGFGAGQWVSDGQFFTHTVLYMFSPEFGEQDMGRTVGSSLVCFGYLAPAFILAVYGMWKTKTFGFLGLYMAVATLLMILMVGKEGSGTNYTFESFTAMCCLSGLVLKGGSTTTNE